MRRVPFLPLALILLLGSACQSGDQSVAASTPTDTVRLNRVLMGLRPPVAVAGRTPVTWSLAERMAHYRVPGVSIVVLDSGRIVWSRGVGVKEAGGADSVTTSTLFQAASISKPVAATATLRLVEQGKLSLDEDVNAKLTSWKVPENPFTATEKVTLRRLLSHSAGTTVHGFPGYAATDPVPTVVQVLNGEKPANTPPVRVDTVPGARWSYSGGGVTIEQLLVTDVTGEAFPALMKRLVLDPVGMTSSTYEQPLPEARAPLAAHAHGSDGVMIPGRWHTYPEMAAAGLWTTPTDLAKWALVIAAARAGRDSSLLSPRMATEMLTIQKGSFGLGPALEGQGPGFRFGHGGSNEGFRAQVTYAPATGQGLAIMTNSDNGDGLIGELTQAIAAEYGWSGVTQRQKTAVTLDRTRLLGLAGDYEPREVPATVTVSLEGDRLFLDAPRLAPKEELLAESDTVFFGAESGRSYVATRDRAGRASLLTIDGSFRIYRKRPSK